jgi:hypothetical protein
MASARERAEPALPLAWQQSALNQRKYCEAHGIPLKAFGSRRARFKAEPQPPVRKLLYRRRGLSHTLSHSVSHSLSHMTYGGAEPLQARLAAHVFGSAKQTSGRYFWRRCGRMRASPTWLKYSNTSISIGAPAPGATRCKQIAFNAKNPNVFRPASRTGSDLTGSYCRSSLSVSIRALTGATVAYESILIPMKPRSRTGGAWR